MADLTPEQREMIAEMSAKSLDAAKQSGSSNGFFSSGPNPVVGPPVSFGPNENKATSLGLGDLRYENRVPGGISAPNVQPLRPAPVFDRDELIDLRMFSVDMAIEFLRGLDEPTIEAVVEGAKRIESYLKNG